MEIYMLKMFFEANVVKRKNEVVQNRYHAVYEFLIFFVCCRRLLCDSMRTHFVRDEENGGSQEPLSYSASFFMF